MATWCDPSDIAAEADGQAILTDFASQRTHRVDPTTDISDVIWDFFTEGVAVAADGPIGDSKPRMDELARYWTVGDLWFERWPLSHILCFAAPAHPCAMDSDEPMDTDEPWADMSSQADGPTGSGLTAPGTEFVAVLCGRERSLRHEEYHRYRG